ncbi:hypothetical protein ILUMI_02700 [Ignelater luminosus]|uniref:Uncharacterized protein n=1 Tax=Ignelater luminosus TaxID=2038154 RepID=A0A8K0DC46_IGNLU|nr:hypothetical protein ILUMI_02700 [Ignelater luminosus]
MERTIAARREKMRLQKAVKTFNVPRTALQSLSKELTLTPTVAARKKLERKPYLGEELKPRETPLTGVLGFNKEKVAHFFGFPYKEQLTQSLNKSTIDKSKSEKNRKRLDLRNENEKHAAKKVRKRKQKRAFRPPESSDCEDNAASSELREGQYKKDTGTDGNLELENGHKHQEDKDCDNKKKEDRGTRYTATVVK